MPNVTAFDSIMLDVETMGFGPNAALIQIGAVAFDSHNGAVCPEHFLCDVDLVSSIMAGGEVDKEVMDWWRAQGGPKGPRKTITQGQAILNLSIYIGRTAPSVERVWAQGPSFDIAICEGFARRCHYKELWPYNAARDTRTVKDIARRMDWEKPAMRDPTHNAVNDCLDQIKVLSSALAHICE